jgi:hypothetical protein
MAGAHRGIIVLQKEINPSRQGTISKRTTTYQRDMAPMPSNAQENLRTSRQNYIEKNNSIRRITLPMPHCNSINQHQPQQLQQQKYDACHACQEPKTYPANHPRECHKKPRGAQKPQTDQQPSASTVAILLSIFVLLRTKITAIRNKK